MEGGAASVKSVCVSLRSPEPEGGGGGGAGGGENLCFAPLYLTQCMMPSCCVGGGKKEKEDRPLSLHLSLVQGEVS